MDASTLSECGERPRFERIVDGGGVEVNDICELVRDPSRAVLVQFVGILKQRRGTSLSPIEAIKAARTAFQRSA